MSKKWDKELNLIAQIEGWLSDEVAELLMSFAARVFKGVIVEVGSWKGKSTVAMALANPRVKIYAVDPFTGSQEHEHLAASKVDTYSEFLENIQKYQVKEQITPLRMTSREALYEVKEDISMVFIDGSHEYDDVKLDFDTWFPRLIPGGVILFHDSKWQGVKRVLWEEFYSQELLGPIDRVEDTTFAMKLSHPKSECVEHNKNLLKLEFDKHRLKRLKRKLKRFGSRLEQDDSIE